MAKISDEIFCWVWNLAWNCQLFLCPSSILLLVTFSSMADPMPQSPHKLHTHMCTVTPLPTSHLLVVVGFGKDYYHGSMCENKVTQVWSIQSTCCRWCQRICWHGHQCHHTLVSKTQLCVGVETSIFGMRSQVLPVTLSTKLVFVSSLVLDMVLCVYWHKCSMENYLPKIWRCIQQREEMCPTMCLSCYNVRRNI